MLQLLVWTEELICVSNQIVLVVAVAIGSTEEFKSLQDALTIFLDDLLLAQTVMAHFEQDQLAVEEKHLTACVVFDFAIALKSFDLNSRYRNFGVLFVCFKRYVDHFKIVEALDQVRVLCLGKQIQGPRCLHHELDVVNTDAHSLLPG